MDSKDGESPEPDDLVGWRSVVAAKTLAQCPPARIVAAIQTLWLLGDERVVGAMMTHIADVMTRRLRKRIGRNHPNEGFDMIDRAQHSLIESILQPDSADGKALRNAFMSTVDFRAADAVRAERLRGTRESYGEDETTFERIANDSHRIMDEHVRVEQLLRRIDDPRKRLAFRLHMEELAKGSKKGASIAKVVGRSAKTVGEWITEIEEQLKEILGDDR